SNAVKFTLRGHVAITVAGVPDQPERVHVAVRDTGIGIDPVSQQAIFEPFRQADEGTTRRFGGSGLGLAIVRQLVRAMGGEVILSSEPSRGSCFEFDIALPRVEPALASQEAEPQPRESVAAATGGGLGHGVSGADAVPAGPDGPFRVLLVEDDPTNRVIIAALLEPTGCITETCENGARAMQALAAREFDLVLMDCQMPELDGLEVSRRVRNGAAGAAARGVPIVALTANAFAEDRAACLGAGMDDFLTKPIRAQVLREVVRRWGTLGRQRRGCSTSQDTMPQTLPVGGAAGPA
ncbi:MAG: response regulator, partial [Ideonella sp.]|nr:response regulator [Ideonella sp.]